MELRELKYFLAVAKAESITKAAEALYVTQPNLSRQMKNLEAELGRQLFERGRRKITLTEAGKLLKKRAAEILELYGRTEQEIKSPDGTVAGDVRVGGGETRAFRLVAEAAARLNKRHPEVTLHIYSGDGEAIAERLEKGLIDFGIFIEPTDLAGYEHIRLPVTDMWGIFVRRDHPLARKQSVTAADLAGEPLIRSRHSLGNSLVSEWFGGDDGLNIVATYNLLYNASLLAERGLGCAVGLDGLLNTDDGPLCFKPLDPPLRSRLDVAWKRGQVFSPAAAAFLTELKDVIAAVK